MAHNTQAPPTLDLATLDGSARHPVTHDGTPIGTIRHPDEFSVVDAHRLQRQGVRVPRRWRNPRPH